MVNVVCTEPSFDSEGGKSIVTAKDNDVLIYPHVDTCMTITLFLANGTVMGGHASMFDMELMEQLGAIDATAALNKFCTGMKSALDGAKINKIVFVGGSMQKKFSPDSHYSMRAAQAVFGQNSDQSTPGFAFVNTINSSSGIDVFFNLGTNRLSVQKYDKTIPRGKLDAPVLRSNPFFEKEFSQLVGKFKPENVS